MYPIQISITLNNDVDLVRFTQLAAQFGVGGAAAVGPGSGSAAPKIDTTPTGGRASSDPKNPTGEDLTKQKAAAGTAAPKDKVAPGGKAHEKKVGEVRKELMAIGAVVGMDAVKEIVGEYADALEKVPTDKLDEVLTKVKALMPEQPSGDEAPADTKPAAAAAGKPAAAESSGDEPATFANTSPLLLKLASKNSAKVQEIIKKHGGGGEKLSKCDPKTYPAIKAALQEALAELDV